ncbi:hypothetical protein CYMTET_55817 [Cymbomonas tetramitiformis]|uniref:Uncharacterized protein n=1 Tax=Cymbomonas tetramitiformis TaxID=36881 RepID=A0AAE0BCJ0_9CHLO|nr:hypothetical protein CYMTET_55817 [Cymbomonas tetramitiformis]
MGRRVYRIETDAHCRGNLWVTAAAGGAAPARNVPAGQGQTPAAMRTKAAEQRMEQGREKVINAVAVVVFGMKLAVLVRQGGEHGKLWCGLDGLVDDNSSKANPETVRARVADAFCVKAQALQCAAPIVRVDMSGRLLVERQSSGAAKDRGEGRSLGTALA